MDNADKGEFSVARNAETPQSWLHESASAPRVCTLMRTEWIIETRDVQWTGCHACMYSRTDACNEVRIRFDVCCFIIMLLTSWLIGVLFALCSFQCSQMAMIADDDTEYFCMCSGEMWRRWVRDEWEISERCEGDGREMSEWEMWRRWVTDVKDQMSDRCEGDEWEMWRRWVRDEREMWRISLTPLTHLLHISLHISHSSPSHLPLISFTSLTHLLHISHPSPSHLSLISFTSPTHLLHISHISPSHLSPISRLSKPRGMGYHTHYRSIHAYFLSLFQLNLNLN